MTTTLEHPSIETSAFDHPVAAPGEPVVSVHNLGKRFKQYASPAARLTEWATLGRRKNHTLFTALDDINFTVKKGEFFGIVGPNGSGKSTLLKILTGVLLPSSGEFTISGRVTSLLELGTGFNPELTGRANLINSARLLGFDVGTTKQKLDQIIAFAELEDSIDVPIKYYSTGMTVRLAFGLFSHVEPDVFIVDEALSVGDVAFSRKCFQRLDVMRQSGCTLLFVSHDLAAVRKYCDHAMFLHHGKCAFLGPAIATTDVYLEAMSPGGRQRNLAPEAIGDQPLRTEAELDEEARSMRATLPPEAEKTFPEASFRTPLGLVQGRIGTGAVRIAAVAILDDAGKPVERALVGQTIHVHLLGQANEAVAASTMSVQLVNRLGVVAWGTNHHRLTATVVPVSPHTWLHAAFDIQLNLGPDEYSIDVGFGDASGEGHVFDRITAVATITLEVKGHLLSEGIAQLPATSTVREYPHA